MLEFEGRIAGGGLILAAQTAAAGATSGPRPAHVAPTARLSRTGVNSDELRAKAAALAQVFAQLSPADRIAYLRREVTGRIVFTTSFGLEDQVILHLLSERTDDIAVVTLDTGRLFPETYALWAQTERRYGVRIRALHPRHGDLETLVERQGINGFYNSRAARLACCTVRKVEPLERALAGARGWIAGLRAEQSAHRQDMALVTAEAERGLIKLNPLFDWTREQLLAFVSRQRPADQPAARAGLRVHRLRALHAGDRPRRAGTRRTLVVGRGKQERVRASFASPVGGTALQQGVRESASLLSRLQCEIRTRCTCNRRGSVAA